MFPEVDPKITCNAMIFAGDTLNLFRLTKSKGALEGNQYQFDPITDGEIILYENGTQIDTLFHQAIFNEGDYPCYYNFKPGNFYHLEANAPGLPAVNASSSMPGIVYPSIISFDPNAYEDAYGNPIGELKFTFPDPGSIENYYLLRLNYLVFDEVVGSVPFNSPDPALGISGGFDLGGGFQGVMETAFSDELFNGETRTFTLRTAGYSSGIQLVLISTDRSTFLYNESKWLQESIIGNPFAEPAPVYNNIENGFGIFGSLVIATDTID
jgi:hypothetical protein